VQTYIPYIRRGGIEHVVSVLAARGAEHHQILDSFEGVHAAESTVATQLSEIHRPGRRQQGRRRLRSDRRQAAGRGQRVRRVRPPVGRARARLPVATGRPGNTTKQEPEEATDATSHER
jgi:hypothetical protein